MSRVSVSYIKKMKIIKNIYFSRIVIIILFLFIISFFSKNVDILDKIDFFANYLYGPIPDNKGRLLTVFLTSIGGIGALWGLYLNYKKVNEQVRQNDISIANSNDKRFGEAIGYLNNENEGIAIGGIYALYQLAKEDKRYSPIITNIFCRFVNDNIDCQEKNSVQTILSLLFSENNPFLFDKHVTFKGLKFGFQKLYCKQNNIEFKSCSFNLTFILYGNKISFSDCNIENSFLFSFSSLKLSNGTLKDSVLMNDKDIYIHIHNSQLLKSKFYADKIVNFKLETVNLSNIEVCADRFQEIIINGLPKEVFSSELTFHYISELNKIILNDAIVKDRHSLNIIQDGEKQLQILKKISDSLKQY